MARIVLLGLWMTLVVLAEWLRDRIEWSTWVAIPVQMITAGGAMWGATRATFTGTDDWFARLPRATWIVIGLGLATIITTLSVLAFQLVPMRITCNPSGAQLFEDSAERSNTCNERAWHKRGATLKATAPGYIEEIVTVPDDGTTVNFDLQPHSLDCVLDATTDDDTYKVTFVHAVGARAMRSRDAVVTLQLSAAMCSVEIIRTAPSRGREFDVNGSSAKQLWADFEARSDYQPSFRVTIKPIPRIAGCSTGPDHVTFEMLSTQGREAIRCVPSR
jgi:hypothetical protein